LAARVGERANAYPATRGSRRVGNADAAVSNTDNTRTLWRHAAGAAAQGVEAAGEVAGGAAAGPSVDLIAGAYDSLDVAVTNVGPSVGTDELGPNEGLLGRYTPMVQFKAGNAS